jgi:hypothetical protein
MGMRVTCRYCKSKIEKKNALQILGEKHNTYYCNQECYSNYFAEKEKTKNENEAVKRAKEIERLAKKQEKERQIEEQKAASAARKAKRDAVYDELCDIFGYEVQNTVLFTEWILWNKLADDEKILAYLKEHKDYIKGATARASGTEYAKIRYMSAILKNNLKDYSNSRGQRAQLPVVDDAMPKESSFVLFEPVKENKKVRKSFAELEDDL